MTSIGSTLYPTLNAYSNLSGLTNSDSESKTNEKTTASVSTGDTVSLSAGVTTAQAREYLGLDPTGTLTLSDFETAATNQETTVSTLLASAMETLGIASDQKVSLSRDGDGNIDIAERFPGKDDLEKLLNENPEFLQAFTGLSTNTEVMDYARSLQASSTSLVDYINKDTSETELLSLAAKYSALKPADSLEGLWRLSHSQTPYTYVHNADE